MKGSSRRHRRAAGRCQEARWSGLVSPRWWSRKKWSSPTARAPRSNQG